MTALEFYKLREQPFGVTPDSRFLFLTPTQEEALSSVIHGIESGCGFVAMIARPGLGKTTLLFQTLNILREKARLVFLFQTISTPLDLLRALLSGLGVQDLSGSLLELQIRLRNLLAEHSNAGKRVVLVIDEAQNLDDSVLELVRMLSNFETGSDKLIQIVLAGQPQLAENIGSPELLQLRQRVSIFARLKPFTAEETTLYIGHRLRIAGYDSDTPLFTKDALAFIAQASEGIPRNVNNFCFNALSRGCALQQKTIDRDIVRQVMADLDLGQFRKKFTHPVPVEERATLKAGPVYSAARPAVQAAKWFPKFPKFPRYAAVAAGAVFAVAAALAAGGVWLARPAAPQPTAVASVPPAPTPPAPPVSIAPETPVPATVNPTAPVPSSPQDATLSPDIPLEVQTSPASAEVPTASPLLIAETTLPPVDSKAVVRVSPGQTLLGICVEQFGSCSGALLRQIHELNPGLNDPDHIEPGQKLRLPVLAAQSIAFEQPRKPSSSDKGTHE